MATGWLDEGEARAWRSYVEMSSRLASALDRQLASSGLSGADYALLAPLSEAPRHTLRARDLGAAAGWDRSRLSHQVRRMEQRGLVARDECPSDARGSFVRLTEEGMEALRAAAPGHVDAVRTYLVDLLSAEELDALGDIARKVLDRLAADGLCPEREAGASPSGTDCA